MDTRVIGLVGGLGPAATIVYYNRLLAACRSAAVTPRLLITHANVETVLAAALRDDRAALATYLGARLAELEAGGATVLALSAVTPHLCMPELRGLVARLLVDIVEVTARELARRKLERVVLLGTRPTVASRMFGRLGPVVVDPSPEQLARIHDLYVGIARAERVIDAAAAELRSLTEELVRDLALDAVVLAGTDLSFAPDEVWAGIEVVDCTQLHVDAIVAAATVP